MSIRIIYDYDLTKLKTEYNYIKNLFPKHDLYIYNNYKIGKNYPFYNINIFIDSIPEQIFLTFPCNITILLVNEQYIIEDTYLRRESYIDSPLIKLDDIVNYYFCLSNYSYNYLINKNIHKNKLILLNGLINKNNNIYNEHITNKQHIINKEHIINKQNNEHLTNKQHVINKQINKHITNKQHATNKQYATNKHHIINKQYFSTNKKINEYIYYEIDKYSSQNNIIMLEIWLKYYINNTHINLIIKYEYQKDIMIDLFKEKINIKKLNDENIYFYKNIILFKKNNYLKKYDKNIKLSIVNFSNFNLLYTLLNNILSKRIIITTNNELTNELCDKSFLFDNFTENNINNLLKKYFQLNDKNKELIITKMNNNLNKKIENTKKMLNNFFKKIHNGKF